MILLCVFGAPGCGKTTVMRELKKSLGLFWTQVKSGQVVWEQSGDYAILGKYDEGDTFAGTDKLSMSCQPHVVKWLSESNGDYKAVLLEGDRLCCQSFFEEAAAIKGVKLVPVMLCCLTSKELDRRRTERGSNQDPTWLKGRMSKIRNLADYCRAKGGLMEVPNNAGNKGVQEAAKKLQALLG
jgi:adenylate kinase family enzyme